MLGRWCTAGLVALLAILLTTSCGHEAAPGNGGTKPGDPAAALPAVPVGPAMDISGAIPKKVLVERDLAKDFPSEWQGGENDSGHVVLMPTVDAPMSWETYRFANIAPYYTVEGVELWLSNYTEPNSNQVFVGFADYNSNTWRWQPLPNPNSLVNFEPSPVTLSIPGGDFLGTGPDGGSAIAVVTFGRELMVSKCVLKVNEPAPAPLGLTVSDRIEDGQIRVSWIDPAISFDPDGPEHPGTYEYDGVDVYRRSTGDWELVGASIKGPFTRYVDMDALPHVRYYYELRTDPNPGPPGQPSQEKSGEIGVRPVAAFETSGTAPDISLNAMTSNDAGDSTNLIDAYHWKVSYPEMPGFVYSFLRGSGDPFTYTLTDMTKVNRIDLAVVDDEGFFSDGSQGYDPTSMPFYLFSPNLGCVQDDPNAPDPKDTVDGHTTRLQFVVSCGQPNYKFEFDSDFDGTFGSTNGIPVVLVKDFNTAPNNDGNKDYMVNIPVAQPAGQYYFAIRVTDQSDPQNQWLYMWPDKVTLAP